MPSGGTEKGVFFRKPDHLFNDVTKRVIEIRLVKLAISWVDLSPITDKDERKADCKGGTGPVFWGLPRRRMASPLQPIRNGGLAYVIIKGTSVWTDHMLNPKEFLQYFPSAVYSAARTVGGSNIFDWDSHMRRLAMLQRSHKPCSESAGGDKQPEKNNERVAQTKTEESSSHPLTTEEVEELFLPAVRVGLTTFLRNNPEHEGKEMKVLFLLTEAEEGLLQPWVHVHALPQKDPEKFYAACMYPAPLRSDPQLKSSAWLKARQSYENLLQEGEEEGLMAHGEEGQLSEGLSSNVFVILKNGTIQTAPDDMVLKGTMRKLVIDTCTIHNIPLVQQAPTLSSALDSWDSVFITSTTRIALPIGEIRVRDPPQAAAALSLPSLPLSAGHILRFDRSKQHLLLHTIYPTLLQLMQERARPVLPTSS
ncbi:putative Aminotransferase class IV [Balamuthia mandrillaris]